MHKGWLRYRWLLTASSVLGLTLLHGHAQNLVEGSSFRSGECYAKLKEEQLIVGNAELRRTWKIAQGRLYATSFFDVRRGVEWIAQPSAQPAPAPGAGNGPKRGIFRGAAGKFGPTQAQSLRVELEQDDTTGDIRYEFQIFPDVTGIRMWIVDEEHAPNSHAVPPLAAISRVEDPLERLALATPHLKVTQVTLRDQTDDHNEVVFENEWLLQPNESSVKLQGDLFFAENILTGDGLIFLKEAPEPEVRPVKNEYDALLSGRGMAAGNSDQIEGTPHFELSFYGSGLDGPGTGYPYVLMAYHGGRSGRIAALHGYQRQLRQYDPQRDGHLASNTWGDRSMGRKLNEQFIRGEIDAGQTLGVETVQVDDGWESGRTSSRVGPTGIWTGYWSAKGSFWKPDATNFPHGLAPVADYAHQRGMELGLWFAPDSQNDFMNWQKDAGQILAWHRDARVDTFKLDSVKIITKRGETNYRALVDTVLKESAGKILLDLDVTAETRQGYLGNIEAGPLYVENRYTDTHRYWPHQTLRNFWKLSQYLDPVRLRMEFLNSARNRSLYPDDPLAPAKYSPGCLFAITMLSSPLAFLETTGLDADYIKQVAPLVSTWKKEREAMQSGTVLPIGEIPDGTTWTGFESVGTDRRQGYLLVFRELNANSHWVAPQSLFAPGDYKVSVLGGKGEVTASNGHFSVDIPEPLGFVWVKLVAKGATQ